MAARPRANDATLRDLHDTCLGSGYSPSPVGRAGLTVCVYTDVHASGSRSLPCAATLSSIGLLLMMPAARLVCQRPSSNFPYFRTPLANFLLSRPNSVEYGNSKTTTLLPSAKCTRPLCQGRTGRGGRPSGWHDIVTCQRLVPGAVSSGGLGATPLPLSHLPFLSLPLPPLPSSLPFPPLPFPPPPFLPGPPGIPALKVENPPAPCKNSRKFQLSITLPPLHTFC